jgi:predicted kinase
LLKHTDSVARLHLVIGPVGSGKSTFALQLSREHRAVRLILDDWIAQLFRADRPDTGLVPWYAERVQRCIEQIWKLAQSIIEVDIDVVLEIGLIQRRERERFYARVDAAGFPLTVYLLDAPRELRHARVERRNHEQGDTFSMVVPTEIFELASDMWEPPDEAELSQRSIRVVGAERCSTRV